MILTGGSGHGEKTPSPPFPPSAKHSLPFMPKSVKLLRGEEARKGGDTAWKGGREREREAFVLRRSAPARFLLGSGSALAYERLGKACKRSKKEDPVQ